MKKKQNLPDLLFYFVDSIFRRPRNRMAKQANRFLVLLFLRRNLYSLSFSCSFYLYFSFNFYFRLNICFRLFFCFFFLFTFLIYSSSSFFVFFIFLFYSSSSFFLFFFFLSLTLSLAHSMTPSLPH